MSFSNFTLLVLAGGFVFGVFAESFVGFGFAFALFFIFLSGVVFLESRFLGSNSPETSNQWLILLSLFLLSMGLGVFRTALVSPTPNDYPLGNILNQKVEIEGVIYEEPDVRENSVMLKVRADKLLKPESRVVDTNILVRTSPFPEFNYGDRVLVSGSLKEPEEFETESGGVFDYPSYLAKDKIFYLLEFSSVKKLESGEGNFIKSSLFFLKKKFVDAINRLIPEPESSLLAGLLVGTKKALGEEWSDRFQRAGVMHIVVLSGYNITIVAESVMKFFGVFLSQTFATSFGVLAIIFFAIMTGGSATVVRATIMALIVILARVTKRKYIVSRALMIAGVIMVIHNPSIVAFDPSFQLSFLATIALIYVSPLVEGKLKFVPEKWKIREVVVSTIATQIFVLPLLLSMTGQFSVVSILVNVLILGLIPITMFFGFWAGFVGIFSTILATPFAYISYALLWYKLGVIEFFASLPFASVSFPVVPGFLVIIAYAIFSIGLFFWHKKKQKNFEEI